MEQQRVRNQLDKKRKCEIMYGIVRIIFWGIVLAIVLLLLKKKSRVTKKRTAIVAITFCLILSTVSALFPVENLFVDFNSPSKVLNYCQSGNSDDVIFGNDSCMVINTKGNDIGGHFITPKSTKGYKIPSLFSVREISHKFDKDGSFDVYNVSGTNDYYLVGTIISCEKKINITDLYNGPIRFNITEMGNTGTKTILIYAFVENFTNEHFIFINGEKVYTAI